MFGFHDFTTDPRSGRPQPHISWLGERLVTWTAWLSALFLLVFAVTYYLKWHEVAGPARLTLTASVSAIIAVWRQNMLARKRAAYCRAVAAYEAMLVKLAE